MSKDSELAKDFKAMWLESKRKRRDNKSKSTIILKNLNIPFTEYNNGTHLVISYQGKIVDFWPSTGAWRYRHSSDTETHRGIFELLKAFGISTEKKDYGNHYPNPG